MLKKSESSAIGNAISRCIWLTMTYMDADGVVRAIEIPSGANITVKAENISSEQFYVSDTEADIIALPPRTLTELFVDRGVRLTIEVRRGMTDDAFIRLHGRP